MNQKSYEKLIPVIVGEWRTGAYSVRDLARNHDVSVGFIAKHTAGIEKDGLAVVNAGIQYKQGLAENDEHFVSAVNDVVNKRTEHIVFFNNAAIKNVSEAMAAKCENQSDYRARAETISKGRETVLGKSIDMGVQVNVGGGSVLEVLRQQKRFIDSGIADMIRPTYK